MIQIIVLHIIYFRRNNRILPAKTFLNFYKLKKEHKKKKNTKVIHQGEVKFNFKLYLEGL